MKIIAFYLPQFHAIPENDEWWGKDFTEWINVKKAKPLFKGHNQPRIPLNNNYYNLLYDAVKRWQIDLAKKYGIYGFCFYHYWFNSKLLLEKPVEQYLANKDLDLPFCISWANEPWTNAWVSPKANKVLIPQRYGNKKEWEEHFYYLLPFFNDERYIKNLGKPLMIIYRAGIIKVLNEMLDVWQELAYQNGLPGIEFAYQHIDLDLMKKKDDSKFTYNIHYQPAYAFHELTYRKNKLLKTIKRYISIFLERHTSKTINYIRPHKMTIVDYDKVWHIILNQTPMSEKCVPGAFVEWDITPRRNEGGSVYVGATPKKFQKYLSKQIKRAKEVYNKDMLFMYAWNEWAQGGYLEPDETNGYGYLEAVKQALIENNEFPEYDNKV